jgi:transcription antitermination factor NusG
MVVQQPDSCQLTTRGGHLGAWLKPPARSNPTMTALASLAEVDEPRALSIADYVGTWIVAGVEPRYERRLVDELTGENGIPSFWPHEHVKIKAKNGDGRYFHRFVKRPLFPGYVFFCCASGKEQQHVSGHRFVHSFLTTAMQDVLRRQLANLEHAISVDPCLSSMPIAVGAYCRVARGPFMGRDVKVVKHHNRDLVVIEIEVLGRMCPVDIDPVDLEPM